MNYIKLQLGCLIVALYVIMLYVRSSLKANIPCNKYFDLIMITAPWAIFFDGVTAWTVNHLNLVPPALNLTCHAIFYILMDFDIFLSFIYFLDITKGVPKSKIKRLIIFLPVTLATVLILVFLKDVYYVEGKITNYSMGLSVYLCYSSCILYFISMLILTLKRIRFIEQRKRIGIITSLSIIAVVLVIQIIFPEVLITSIVTLMVVVGFYINIEDPTLILLKNHNSTMVTGFATLVENRDNSTGGHIVRTKVYVSILLERMKQVPHYYEILSKDFLDNMLKAAPMHDIGKISTPDQILQKPGKLTDEEYAIMKRHAPDGGEIIIETFGDLEDRDFLKVAYDVARFHHEKWNGRGYPEGLKEKQIPLSARIMAIADVFDAVSANRCYRKAMPIEQCFKIIEEGRGTDFDPELTDLFLSAKNEILEFYNKTIDNL